MATNDYCNIAVRGNHDVADLLPSLLPGAAFVAPVAGGSIVFPEPDAATPHVGDFLAHSLSCATHGAVLLSEVSGDVLRLRLFDDGVTVDEYVAETPDDGVPTGGNAPALLATFGAPASDAEFLAPLLRASRFDDDYGYGAASDRHAEIADLLGVPTVAGIGYEAITQGKLPEGIAQSDLRQFAGTGSYLQEFTLLRVPDGTSETEVASYVLPDMVSLERGIEVDDWVSDFGTLATVRETIADAADVVAPSDADWLTAAAGDAALHFDFGFRNDVDTVETIRVFVSAPLGTTNTALRRLADIAQAVSATVWDWRTRRVVVR
ncbi:MAG: hypothetical protein H7Y38_09725 [Armatimonadetes bacterium]|nr:hypothetical protein [Armatimonadota bacterium]